MNDRGPHLAELRDTKQRRLDALEVQASQFGFETPAHITNEIDQLRIDLARLSMADAPPVSDDVRKVLRRYDAIDLITQTVAGVVVRLTLIEQAYKADGGERVRRQVRLNLWLGLISFLLIVLIIRFVL